MALWERESKHDPWHISHLLIKYFATAPAAGDGVWEYHDTPWHIVPHPAERHCFRRKGSGAAGIK